MKRVFIFCVVIAALTIIGRAQVSTPRAEYPRPQFQRDAWQTLNGRWSFEFDDQNVGLTQKWWTGSHAFGRTITVPFCFESPLGGINDRSFHPWVWYRRSTEVPAAWKGRRVLLNFGAVDYRAMVWVNGQYVGSHEGGNTPFSFDVTPLVDGKDLTIVVRAEDPPTDRSIPRGKQYWEPQSRSIFYTRTSGIWQSVWIEAAGETYLETARIVPSNDGTIRVDARIAHPAPDMELAVTVRWKDQVVAAGSARGSIDRLRLAAAVSEPRLWSPGSPNLYDLTFELRRGSTVLDRVSSYTGFRSVGTRDGRFTLNGEPVTLKFVLDQGYWHDGILTPPSDDAIQYDIRMTKEMGFNGARKHQKVEDPRFLYWADKMGFLVSSEMANSYLYDNVYAARFTREWIEAVERDINHPSVVVWAPLNESWGVPDLSDPRQQAHLRSLYSLTHSLDGTRPVIDNEGWEHTEATDLFAIHDYVRTGDLLADKYKTLGLPGVTPSNGSDAPLAPGMKYNGTPVYLSEFGGIAFIPPGHQVPQQAWGYSGVEKTQDAALERLRGLFAAIGKVPAFAGYCYTQLTDVEQEINGLMTYDRKMKFDAKAIADINRLVR